MSKICCNFAAKIEKGDIMNTDVFIRYNTPEQYAEAFQQMIDAREKWREEIRQQETQAAL